MAQNNEKEVKKCNLCDYTSTHTGRFNCHKRIHTGEKPFKCNQCDFATSQAVNLKFHIMRHNGETPFKCNQCNFSAVRQSDFKKHTLTKHTQSEIKCDECEFNTPYPEKIPYKFTAKSIVQSNLSRVISVTFLLLINKVLQIIREVQTLTK